GRRPFGDRRRALHVQRSLPDENAEERVGHRFGHRPPGERRRRGDPGSVAFADDAAAMHQHNRLREATGTGIIFGDYMVQRLGQGGGHGSHDAWTGARGRGGHLAVACFVLGEADLASGMKDAAPEWPVVDGTTVDEAGKAGADLSPLPIHFLPYQAASGAELGFDCLVVELGGVQAPDEGARAQLVACEVNGYPHGANRPPTAYERDARPSQVGQSYHEPPVLSHPIHLTSPVVVTRISVEVSFVAVCRRADTAASTCRKRGER